MVNQISGEPVATPPTERLRQLCPASDPSGTPVAWCGSLPIGPETYAILQQLIAAGQIPTAPDGSPLVLYAICDQTDPSRDELLETNEPGYAARLAAGESLVWDTPTTLTYFGLVFRQTEAMTP